MVKAIMVDIPIEELGEYKDYIGYLFVGENGVYSVLNNVEDIQKANQWFKCFPKKVYIVSRDEEVSTPGEKILGVATNMNLHNKIFTYLGQTKNGVDISDFRDENGEIITSTDTFLKGSYKFIRMANDEDKKLIVEAQNLYANYPE